MSSITNMHIYVLLFNKTLQHFELITYNQENDI